MRIVEIITDTEHSKALAGIAEHYQITEFWKGVKNSDGRRSFRMLVDDETRQSLIDALQNLLGPDERSRVMILPVDTVIKRTPEDEEANKRNAVVATREELYDQIEGGARLDNNFLLLTVLSTIVASIGLIENNIAAIIGAMVIAPLLGPNIALSFAASLGDRRLMWQALKTNLTGVAIAFGLAVLVGLFWPDAMESPEIQSRTSVGLGDVALALASGAAAVLSLTTGISSTLVGVMVAVALLPPTATIGLLLGAGQGSLASGAMLLLAVNVICVLLSAMMVFLVKGIRPRTWYERSQARQSVTFYIFLWIALLLVLIAIILLRSPLVE
ncbi:MAG: TIGR00341 family protein [Gammaproteobacteria bacterium]|nr:TIGR00341 family protein [Gammaproteobacteria bacterium]